MRHGHARSVRERHGGIALDGRQMLVRESDGWEETVFQLVCFRMFSVQVREMDALQCTQGQSLGFVERGRMNRRHGQQRCSRGTEISDKMK